MAAASDTSKGTSLFAYGSLQLDAVMEAVTGRRFRGRPAVLTGHRRRLLAGRSYPGVMADPGESTRGVLFEGLDGEALEILDLFEDDAYARRRCVVHCDGVPRSGVFVYVIRDACADLMTDDAWDLSAFRDRSLSRFLEQCRAFRVEALADGLWKRPT